MAAQILVLPDPSFTRQFVSLVKILERQSAGEAERLALAGMLQLYKDGGSLPLRDLTIVVNIASAQGSCIEEARALARQVNEPLRMWANASAGLKQNV